MNILFATSECAPFIKTGGLADVAGALPKALAGNGHDVRVILPLYEGIGEEWRSQMTYLQCFHITLAWRSPYCGIFELKRDGVTYWFVDNEYYFKRSNIYGHYDDGERFAYFSRAVVESMGWLNWHPDVLHCNDWQTALVPIYLLEERHRIPQLCDTKSVFTIHNIEYQGRYGSQTLKDVFGLNDGYFNEHMLAYHGDVNLMKGAIYAADYVTTVSPTYADELQYSFYAHGHPVGGLHLPLGHDVPQHQGAGLEHVQAGGLLHVTAEVAAQFARDEGHQLFFGIFVQCRHLLFLLRST